MSTDLSTYPNGQANISEEQHKLLCAPFHPTIVRAKPQSWINGRPYFAAYIEVRAVHDRLDKVVGSSNWTANYFLLRDDIYVGEIPVTMDNGSIDHPIWDAIYLSKQEESRPPKPFRMVEVQCALQVFDTIKINVGAGGDFKSAYSDSLKRAAIDFGVGRYLYDLPMINVPHETIDGRIQPKDVKGWRNKLGLYKAYQKFVGDLKDDDEDQ